MAVRLSNFSLIPPGALHSLAGRRDEVLVLDDGSIRVLDMVLRPAAGQPALTPGSKVQVWLSDHFYCDTAEAIAAAQAKRLEDASREQAELADRRNRRRAESEAFNAQFELPVQWVAGHKDVLSGLSETSWGDGYRRGTVEHILLKEKLTAGALVRNAGDFLCTARAGSNGKAWAGQPESFEMDGSGHRFMPKISCKSCLRLAARWQRESENENGKVNT